MRNLYCLLMSLSFIGCGLKLNFEPSSHSIMASEPLSWVDGVFAFQFTGAVRAEKFHPGTLDRYVVARAGQKIQLAIERTATLSGCVPPGGTRGLSPASGEIWSNLGALTVSDHQIYDPAQGRYLPSGQLVLNTIEFQMPAVPTPLLIWLKFSSNRCISSGGWSVATSNGVVVWLYPEETRVPQIAPPVVSGSPLNADDLNQSLPIGRFPKVFLGETDELRLRNSIGLLNNPHLVRGASTLTDLANSRGNQIYISTSNNALTNAALGWANRSSAHLEAARLQLKTLFSRTLLGSEVSTAFRTHVSPTTDLLGTYGSYFGETFFKAYLTTCILGPEMANVLTANELREISANLYQFAVHHVYASLQDSAQYYTADGGHNLHFRPIIEAASWIWGKPEFIHHLNSLSRVLHTDCSYYLDDFGIGKYALRYCVLADRLQVNYEDENRLTNFLWMRTSGFLGVNFAHPIIQSYMNDRFGGVSLPPQDRASFIFGNLFEPSSR
jgi:hypothetical protein